MARALFIALSGKAAIHLSVPAVDTFNRTLTEAAPVTNYNFPLPAAFTRPSKIAAG